MILRRTLVRLQIMSNSAEFWNFCEEGVYIFYPLRFWSIFIQSAYAIVPILSVVFFERIFSRLPFQWILFLSHQYQPCRLQAIFPWLPAKKTTHQTLKSPQMERKEKQTRPKILSELWRDSNGFWFVPASTFLASCTDSTTRLQLIFSLQWLNRLATFQNWLGLAAGFHWDLLLRS